MTGPAIVKREDAAPGGREPWLTAGVGSVAATSFLSDAGHEMATALLPGLLTSTLHAGPGALGVIEGVSDALTGLAKIAAGPAANDPARRARLARGGYLVTAAATGALGAVGTVWQAGVLRATAWTARGVRSPARDSLLASLTPPGAYGRAYGLERAGDNLGAVAGPLLAALLVSVLGVRTTLYLSVVPGLLAAAAITVAARQAATLHADPAARTRIRLGLAELRRAGIVRALIPVAAFECGNVAATLLILRATDLLHTGSRSATAATSIAILLYAGYNACGALAALAGGRGIDRAGPRAMFAVGAGLFAAGYALFAAAPAGLPAALVAFVLAGAGIGLAESAESTLIARMLPDELRGSGFGLLGLVQAVGDLASTLVVGLLWAVASPAWGFGYAAAWMLAAIIAAVVLRPRSRA